VSDHGDATAFGTGFQSGGDTGQRAAHDDQIKIFHIPRLERDPFDEK
jgi:hypothetical protein